MAAAFFNRLADRAKARAISAGTRPAQRVHPGVVTTMGEVGVDLSAVKPQRLTPELAAQAQVLITMGCGEECPVVPGVRRFDWPLADPADASPDGVREIREQVRELVRQLIAGEGWGSG